MILDRTWNKKEQKLIISYIDRSGNRKFLQKALRYIPTYEYDENGEFETWNNRRCNQVYKDTTAYTPNDFDILEFMYKLPDDLKEELHAQVFPKVYTFDIETESNGEFPDPKKAQQKVTSISLVGPDMSCIVYGLKRMSEEQIATMRMRYLEWIDNNEFASKIKKNEPKVLYQYFSSEGDMLKHFFTVIIKKVSVLAGWNSYNFDWQYLVNRCINLFGKQVTYNLIRSASPTGETTTLKWEEVGGELERAPAPCHSIIIDYMEIVKKYDYILRPYESYSLDWVASHAINAHKIKYEGTLQQLYERDYEWYYYYNAIDSLLTLLIHYKLKPLESPCAVSSVTLVPLLQAMGQVALTTANVFEEFYKDNKKVVYDYDAIERHKEQYDGAFCGCVPGKYDWCVCDDFASLYPSQVQTCNFSFENIIENVIGPDSLGRYTKMPWSEEQLDKFRNDPNYFVSLAGNVYKNDKDYAFKKMQRRIKRNRDTYKYTGQKIDSELLVEINKLIQEKNNNK